MCGKFLYMCNTLSLYGLYFDIKINQKQYIRIRFWYRITNLIN